jgi:hypothetical protein
MPARTTSALIAILNDQARTTMGIGCRLVQTPGISALDPRDQSRIREKVETFAEFTPANDPRLEHDFGAFDHGEDRIYWKIDYYDKSLNFHSDDPTNPALTTRVLTIMLSTEY